jgi:hypothetical protein
MIHRHMAASSLLSTEQVICFYLGSDQLLRQCQVAFIEHGERLERVKCRNAVEVSGVQTSRRALLSGRSIAANSLPSAVKMPVRSDTLKRYFSTKPVEALRARTPDEESATAP